MNETTPPQDRRPGVRSRLPAAAWTLVLPAGIAIVVAFYFLPLRGLVVPADLLWNVPRHSPFLEERYRSPISADAASLMTTAVVLGITGHHGDTELLRNIVKRRVLKRALGEPFEPAGSIEEALHAEAKESESTESLRLRVMGRVTVQRISAGGDVRITKDDDRRGHLHVRLQAANLLTEPAMPEVLHFEGRGTSSLGCTPEAGVPVPAGATATLICSTSGHLVPLEATRRALDEKAGGSPIDVFNLRIPRDNVMVTTRTTYPGGFYDPFTAEARRQVDGAGCHALLACEEMDRRAQERARKHFPQLVYLAGVLVLAGLMGAACLRMRRRDAAGSPAVSFLTGVTIVACAVEVLYVLLMLGAGLAAMFMWGFLFYEGVAQIAVTLVLAGVLAWKRREVTRFRIFVLGMAVTIPVSTVLFMFRCQVSPYTLSLTCG